MTVKTAKVTGRRELHFHSLADVLDDAEQLASGEVKALGNWSLGQALTHLAVMMNHSIDGAPYTVPRILRLIGPLIKRRILYKPMSAGYRLTKNVASVLVPSDTISTADGLESLRAAIHRLQTEHGRKPHAVFGRLTPSEWEQLHLRHSELHLSFFVPGSQAS